MDFCPAGVLSCGMTDEIDNLVLEHLRVLRAEMAGLRDDVRELKTRQSEIARQVAGLRRD